MQAVAKGIVFEVLEESSGNFSRRIEERAPMNGSGGVKTPAPLQTQLDARYQPG